MSASCSLWNAPPVREGRDPAGDPARELLVVHGRAETLSSLTLDETGAVTARNLDLTVLGASPNAITAGAAPSELAVTLSGENAVLFIDESSLTVTGRLTLPVNSNPMESLSLGRLVAQAPDLWATTTLVTGAVRVHDAGNRRWSLAEGSVPVNLAAGAAPQALTALPAPPGSSVRLVTAATAFGLGPSDEQPFGTATLTVIDLSVDGAAEPQIQVIHQANRPFRDPGSAVVDTAGLNPTALHHLSATGELLVVGSGVNYGSGGGVGGADDGELLILADDSLAVLHRLSVGGSPGSVVVVGAGGGAYRVYLGGVEGIRMAERHGDGSWSLPTSGVPAYSAAAAGGLSLIADVAVYHGGSELVLYAADYWNDRVLVFGVDGADGSLTLTDTVPVSAGPQALAVVEE